MIGVDLYLYAYLRRYRPEAALGRPVHVEVEEQTSVAKLLDRVGIPRTNRLLVFINGVSARDEDVLAAGDRVAVFPPIAGGV